MEKLFDLYTRASSVDEFLEAVEKRQANIPFGNLRPSTDKDIRVLTALFEKEQEGN